MAKKATISTSPVVRNATFPGGVTKELRRITPAQAQAWLRLTTKPVDLVSAEKFKREILAHRLKNTGRNDIVFYDDGKLAFGQNELKGIVLANVPHTMFITRGINRATAEIDCMRADAYFSRVMGVQYSTSIVAAVRRVLVDRTTGGTVITTRPSRIIQLSNTEIRNEYVGNQSMYDAAVVFALNVYSRSGRLLKVSETAAHYVFAMTDLGCSAADINAFYDTLINSLTTGTPIPSNDFMRRIQADALLRAQLMSIIYRNGYFTECWNKWRTGVNTALSYTPATHPGLSKV